MFLRISEVCQRYKISRSTLWAWTKKEYFPHPAHIGPGNGAPVWPMHVLSEFDRSCGIAEINHEE